MKQIESFNRKNLHNNEYLSFYREVESVILEEEAEKLSVSNSFALFQKNLQTFDDCIVRVAASALTEKMVAADGERDNKVVGIFEQIRTATRHFVPEKRQAAEVLMPVVKTFQGITRKSFDDETGFVDNLLQTCRLASYLPYITVLGLEDWLDELEKSNTTCRELTSGRSKEDMEKYAAGRSADARKAADVAYNDLVARLNALALVNGDILYSALFDYMNQRIDHYRNVLAHRTSTSQGGGIEE